ncbi:PAAR repeat-containing protein [Pectobacterium parmentieri WPP163]|nr:PAAR repeat-containing protein [Pectobacterium parmentieri WPP163]AYH07687.1 type VI secretion system PAAR protein [Pectobacterium parmentieri]AYH16440.1 type VI secretion system PAAR protein [Pectobacterium parmentieri]AYH25140.1 type VI secretion system PAAR protein [Pectobacterium parmentieri]MBN3177263.1 type VI secretion system PAAR protein [Pectobacterium parmentieri]
MARNAAKVGDIGTDHDGFPSTPIIAGSSNVFIDGKSAARVTDPLEEHSKPGSPPHPRHIASGSCTVFVNGLPLAITGGTVDCGGEVVGSGTVFVGDNTPDLSGLVSPAGMFDEAFILKSQQSGEPIANREYRILRADGRYEYGKTDDKGKTHTVFSFTSEELSIEIRDE